MCNFVENMLHAVLRTIITIGLVLGVLYEDDCPKQSFIPIFLTVAGAYALLANFIALAMHCCGEWNYFCSLILHIINFFLMCWFVPGGVWTYGAYRPNYWDEDSPEYCNGIVYLYSFCMIPTAAFLTIVILVIHLKFNQPEAYIPLD